jgi:hypothetical protein
VLDGDTEHARLKSRVEEDVFVDEAVDNSAMEERSPLGESEIYRSPQYRWWWRAGKDGLQGALRCWDGLVVFHSSWIVDLPLKDRDDPNAELGQGGYLHGKNK